MYKMNLNILYITKKPTKTAKFLSEKLESQLEDSIGLQCDNLNMNKENNYSRLKHLKDRNF